MFPVGQKKHGFQFLKVFVPAPLLGEFHCGPCQIAVVLLQLGFEKFKECEGISRGSGKAGQNVTVSHAADFARRVLHNHCLAEGDLAIAGHRHVPVFLNGQNGCGVHVHRAVYIFFHISTRSL